MNNKIPILETRGLNEEGIISPKKALNITEALPDHIDTAVIFFDHSPATEILQDCKPLFNFIAASCILKQYIYKNKIVVAYSPLGSASAGGLLEELIAFGIKKGIPISKVKNAELFDKVVKVKYTVPNDELRLINNITNEIDEFYEELYRKYEQVEA